MHFTENSDSSYTPSIKIAVLLTCFNRKEKTEKALKSLFEAEQEFINTTLQKLQISIFLTDDGCTDGTSDAVRSIVGAHECHIVRSDGSAFWAGGMRLAWEAALTSGIQYDFYLLLNDDTSMTKDCFVQLMQTDAYSIQQFGKHGVYTAFVSDPGNEKLITYGAKVYKNSFLHGAVDLEPTGQPIPCNMPNANILLVSRDVVDEIGILDEIYVHGAADWDYGMKASKAGFPVLTTPGVCGYCEFDHDKGTEEEAKVLKMSVSDRKKFILRPTYFYSDGLKFSYKYNRPKYYLSKLIYYIFVYTPGIYYYIFKKRGH